MIIWEGSSIPSSVPLPGVDGSAEGLGEVADEGGFALDQGLTHPQPPLPFDVAQDMLARRGGLLGG